MNHQFIAIDWGTSCFRAYLAESGSLRIIDQINTNQGMKSLASNQFASYCQAQISHWRAKLPDLPIYLSGMVGAPEGWLTAPQLTLPVDLAQLAIHLTPIPDLVNGWIIAGVKELPSSVSAHCDVMRGEEIQFLGALLQERNCLFACAPGTHSKWAQFSHDTIVHFTTLMTGELYDLLIHQSLLGRPIQTKTAHEETAFMLGLARSHAEEGILHALFEARSRYLYADLKAEQISSFISGVLIGSETSAMLKAWPELTRLTTAQPLLLIGNTALAQLYATALSLQNIPFRLIDPTLAILAGIDALHQQITS